MPPEPLPNPTTEPAPSPSPSPAPAPNLTPAPAPSPTPAPSPAPTPAPSTSDGARSPSFAPSAAQPRRSAEDDSEYRTNYTSAEYIGALTALDNGWDGQGVLVGVLDNGVKEVAELEGQISDLSRDFGGIRENGVLRPHDTLGDEYSEHGTLVGEIIAARNDGTGVQGFAPGAQLVVLRTDVQDLDNSTETVGANSHGAIRYAGENGVMIVNRSLAKINPDVSNRLMRDAVRDYAAMGGIVINAAGNDGLADPNDAIDLTDENREGWLFVVALAPTGSSYELATYSNKCGVAMDRCVAGVGTNVTAGFDGNLVRFSGTSSATPQVSAVAAMILSKWPQLTGVDAGNIILETARDIGPAGVDTTFGHGLVDAAAALAPVEPALSNGSASTPVSQSAMVVPQALAGDEDAVAAALAQVTVLDAYGRDYSGDLSGLVFEQRAGGADVPLGMLSQLREARFAVPGSSASMRIVPASTAFGPAQLIAANITTQLGDGKQANLSYQSPEFAWFDEFAVGPTVDPVAAIAPQSALTAGLQGTGRAFGWGVSVIAGSDRGRDSRGLVGSVERGGMTLRLGYLDERGAVFGSPTGTGALRFGDGAQTAFAQIEGGTNLGDWDLSAYVSAGATRLRLAGDTLLTDASTIPTGRFGFGLRRQLAGGYLTLGVAQPLVALGGKARFSLASGYDRATQSLTYSRPTIDLGGSFAPWLSAGFERMTGTSSLRLGLGGQPASGAVRALGTWRLILQ